MIETIKRVYNNKNVEISFIYNEAGKSLKHILETCYKDEMSNNRYLNI
ncbi:MAG: hypothetical protein IJ399_00320 [Bacilli bacterium]|jgi:hypothetical protein|nr:hypothetical protein [Bacilli bacterium]